MKVTSTIVPLRCPQCGVIYGLDSSFYEKRKCDGKSWRCPNDHGVVHTKTKADELAEELRIAKEYAARLEVARERDCAAMRQRNHHISALKGVITKLKNALEKRS